MSSTPSIPKETGPVICVFCGSSPGTSPAHLAAARSLAEAMASINAKLVYGGGTSGLMGEIAKTLVSLSGPESVHGVIPEALMAYERLGRPVGGSSESTSDGSTGVDSRKADSAIVSTDSTTTDSGVITPNTSTFGKTTIVTDMHTRKKLMAQLVISGGPGSGFVALSGGFGTLEEIMEIATWNQLGIHSRGVVLFNVDGYWDGIVSWINHAISSGFVREGNRGIVVEARTAEGAVKELREYKEAGERFVLDWGQS